MGGGVEVEAKEGGGGQTMVKTGVGGPRRPGIAVLARPLVLRGGRRGARGRARRACFIVLPKSSLKSICFVSNI